MDRGRPLTPLARGGALALVSAFVALVPAASAADPLLSGYSGPGGGEQVVIGSKVLPPKTGNGALRRDVSAAAPSIAPAPAESSTPDASDGRGRTASPENGGQASAVPALAAKPTYPNRVSSASSLPLAKSDLLLIALAGAVVLAIGLLFSRYRIVPN